MMKLGQLIKDLQELHNKVLELMSQEGQARPGDVLGVSRLFYEHYGIYTGDDMVIHYNLTDDGSKLVVRKTGMDRFLQSSRTFFVLDCEYRKPHKSPPIKYREVLDYLEKIKVFSPEETIKRAESRLGEEEYNILFNNCEHFAIWCKTGISQSHQVEEFLKLIPRIPFRYEPLYRNRRGFFARLVRYLKAALFATITRLS